MQFNDEKYGYIVNLQGDVVGLIDNAGTEVVKYVYDAWGKILSTTGALASTLGSIQPFRYRGYVFDQETGLYYLKSRFYGPTLCRYINDDNIIVAYCICAQNFFSYCRNHAVNMCDTSGNWEERVYAGITPSEIQKFIVSTLGAEVRGDPVQKKSFDILQFLAETAASVLSYVFFIWSLSVPPYEDEMMTWYTEWNAFVVNNSEVAYSYSVYVLCGYYGNQTKLVAYDKY